MSDVAEIPTTFKTALPPRKRAKTKEEKEQRRVERILRNRKAAHASREKKRKHVEFLESYVVDIEKQLHLVNKLNSMLLHTYTGGNAEIDGLVQHIADLPDLKLVKMKHNLELDEDFGMPQPDVKRESSVTMPKTPESFTSDSPKSSYEDEDVPSRMDASSVSSTFGDDALFSDPIMDLDCLPMNKFSLDIVTGNNSLVKQELPQQVPNPEPFKTEENDSLSFVNDNNDVFDFQANSDDNEFGFNELRNPAEITVSCGSLKIDNG